MNINDSVPKVRLLPSCRLTLAFMQFTGCLCVYLLRVNISMAIVCMTSDPLPVGNVTTQSPMTSPQPVFTSLSPLSNSSNQYNISAYADSFLSDDASLRVAEGHAEKQETEAEFQWNRDVRGYILSSFFIGYILTQFPGSWLANRFSAKWLVFASMSSATILTFLSPMSARYSPYMLMFVQILKGFSMGAFYPCIVHLLSCWSPPLERARLVAFSLSGSTWGSVIAFSVSGILCEHGFDGGWPSIFHVYGLVTVVWLVFWALLVYDSPEVHPRISAEEKDYIQLSLGISQLKVDPSPPVPWKGLLTSLPFYAILVVDVAYSWGWYTALTSLPQYMEDVLKFNIEANGIVNAIPYVTCFVVSIVAASTADALLIKRIVSAIVIRKFATTMAMVVPCIFLVAVGFLDSSQWLLAVVFLTVVLGMLGFIRAGTSVNILEVAGRYAAVGFSISSTIANLSGFLAPTVTSALTPNGLHEEWRNVFFVCGGFFLVAEVMYMIFASANMQPWAGAEVSDTVILHDEQASLEDSLSLVSSGFHESITTLP